MPQASVVVLGGDEAPRYLNGDRLFAQPGVQLLGHRDDVPELLQQSALTINPLRGIRGSAIKLVESLLAGRACVSTAEGARGFAGCALPGLVVVPKVEDMAAPIVALLRNEADRHRVEAPDASELTPFEWRHCAALQRGLYRDLLRHQ